MCADETDQLNRQLWKAKVPLKIKIFMCAVGTHPAKHLLNDDE